MMRMSINLATRPFRNNAVHWIGFSAGFLLLGVFGYYNAVRFTDTSEDLRMWGDKLAKARQEFDALAAEVVAMTNDVRKVDLKAFDERSRFANGIILSRLFSWTILFDRLEKVLPENVRVRSIRPAITRDGIEVTVDGAAREYPSILRFEENLLASDHFTFVYPQMESTKEGQGEIQFVLTFGYVPAGKSASAAPAPEAEAANEAGGAEEGAGEAAAAPAGAAGGDEEEALGEGEEYLEDEEEPGADPNGPGAGGEEGP
jgi:type IV pilus assembly protein PilN